VGLSKVRDPLPDYPQVDSLGFWYQIVNLTLKQGDALPAVGLSKARDRLCGPRAAHPDFAVRNQPQRILSHYFGSFPLKS